MSYRSLMVYLDLEHGSKPVLRVACELADRFKSDVIGMTAGLPAVAIYADAMIAPSVLEVDELTASERGSAGFGSSGGFGSNAAST